MRYDWLLIDMDDTLFDYSKAQAGAVERTLREVGADFQPEFVSMYNEINLRMWRQYDDGEITVEHLKVARFETFLGQIGVKADAKVFGVRYLENLALGGQLLDDAETVVRALHGEVGMIIVTNGFTKVQNSRLALSPIAECMTDVVTSEEVGTPKPGPEIFAAALERIGNPPKNRALMVGDNLHSDIKGALDYGIDVCWFNPAHAPGDADVQPQHEIDELPQLLPIVSGK